MGEMIDMQRYPGTGLFVSKRRYMAAVRDTYPLPIPQPVLRAARALRRARHAVSA